MTQANHTAAAVVANWLINMLIGDNPLVTSPTWPIFINACPETPDTGVIGVFDIDGVQHGRNQRTGETYEHPGVQIAVKSKREPEGANKMQVIKGKVDELRNADVLVDTQFAYRLKSITRRTPPISAGRDPETEKALFTLNCLVDYTPADREELNP